MKQLKVLISASIITLFTGCGGGGGSSDENTLTDTTNLPSNTIVVSGPGGAFEGAKEFTTAMIAGQSIYEWNDVNDNGIAEDDEWLRATFKSNGDLLFERNGTSEIVGSYTVVDGKIIATTVDGDTTIILNTARATEWDITFIEDNESTTWFLELKYNAAMLVNNKFSLQLPEGTFVVKYGETTAKIYDENENLVGEEAYAIEDGVLVHDSDGARNKRYLIKLYSDGSLLSWNAEDPEANLFTDNDGKMIAYNFSVSIPVPPGYTVTILPGNIITMTNTTDTYSETDTYYANGNLHTQHVTNSNPDGSRSWGSATYDVNGYKVESETVGNDSIGSYWSIKITYTYDVNGNLLTVEEHGTSNGIGISQRTTYTYDENGVLIDETIEYL